MKNEMIRWLIEGDVFKNKELDQKTEKVSDYKQAVLVVKEYEFINSNFKWKLTVIGFTILGSIAFAAHKFIAQTPRYLITEPNFKKVANRIDDLKNGLNQKNQQLLRTICWCAIN